MDYISTIEAAQKWGISQRRVIRLADEGRIEGARKFGINWMIPITAEKPVDGRTKAARMAPICEDFRFPLFVNHDEEDYAPALTMEELQLRSGQLAFYACRFGEAKKMLLPLAEKSSNRYVRIAALFHMAYIGIYNNSVRAENYLNRFRAALGEDFLHHSEMKLLAYQLDKDLGRYEHLFSEFRIDSNDNYHPSSHDTMVYLSCISLIDGDASLYSRLRFETYELECIRMEREGHFYEAQELHQLLLEMYRMKSNDEMALYHWRRSLEIAMEHELYYRPAINIYYYPDLTARALEDFPADFAKRIRKLGAELHEQYIRFAQARDAESYWDLLSDKEFVYITYAVQGYSNKEVSGILKISEKTVSKRYGEIYEKLGVNNKQELVENIKRTQQGGN